MKIADINKAHFIGVGGIGMSALAQFFVHEGISVSGSDRSRSLITGMLEEEGIQFFDTQVPENISEDIDIVVYTEAMSKDHPEMVAAHERGLLMMNYFAALGMAVNEYHLIAVAGSHGKTTTTAMLTDVFEAAEKDPTAVIGSLRSKTKRNFRAGKSQYAIVEACEYKRDFLHLAPTVLVITNIEAEHLDYYKDLEDVQNAFREMAEKVPAHGAVIANVSDPNVAPVVAGLSCTVIDYTKFIDPLLDLKVPGLHNQMNAAAAIAAAVNEGIAPRAAKAALELFAGTWRRFEYKGEVNGAKVYDDYGHHPTEIRATMQGARELYPDRKIVLVYQPHLDKRTETLFDDFVRELGKADTLILTPAYVARDVGSGEHSSTKKLFETIAMSHAHTEYIEDIHDIASRLKEFVKEQDVVLVMGAGDITKVTEELL